MADTINYLQDHLRPHNVPETGRAIMRADRGQGFGFEVAELAPVFEHGDRRRRETDPFQTEDLFPRG